MKNNDIKTTIEHTFDDVSDLYDINEYFLITAKDMVENLQYRENLNILDLSCGTGNITLQLASKFKTSKIEGLDLSSNMVEVATQKAKEQKLSNVEFNKADVEKLIYDEKSFDIITCGFGLFFYPNMVDSFKNFIKLLKDDGVFLFSSFTKEAFTPYSDMFMETLQKDYGLEYPKGSSVYLETNEEIQDLISNVENLNFNIKELKISRLITPQQWWDTLNSAGYKGMLNQLSKDDLEKFKKQHLEEIEKLCVDGKIELKTNTLITTVKKGKS